jgi:isoquinoline 1-oxidoreductase subunit beta
VRYLPGDKGRDSEGSGRQKMNRRAFFQLTALAGGGLALSLLEKPARAQRQAPPPLAPFAFVEILSNGTVRIMSRSPEVGQGIKTSSPMLIAEELDVPWKSVQVVQADLDPKYGIQFSGGSLGTPFGWEPLRRAGATARALLIAAAAKEWGVPEAECKTDGTGSVIHTSGKKLAYGALAAKAAALPLPDPKTVAFKDPKDYRIIGKPTRGVDVAAIVTGKPIFGIDFTLPGMLTAVYVKCPVLGGRVKSANTDDIKKLPGVKHVLVYEGPKLDENIVPNDPGLESGIAIVADHFWAAQSAREKLKVTWDEGRWATQSSAEFAKKADELSKAAPQRTLGSSGDVEKALGEAAKVVEGAYAYPFIAHAPLEPQNTTALFKDGKLEVWTTSQTPDGGRGLAAQAAGIEPKDITTHLLRAGGGFGRRLYNDYFAEAAYLAKQIPGVPVKVMWTREDDFAHDYYRPGGFQYLKAGLDVSGKLVAWKNHLVSYGDGMRFAASANLSPGEFPARFVENFALHASVMPLGLKTGALRAPGSNAYAFVIQSFLDELAHAAGKDSLAFLKALIEKPMPGGFDVKRMNAVLDKVAEVSGWGKKTFPKNRAMGIAFHFSHQGYFAQVAEVSVKPTKRLKIEKIWVAGDVGSQIINPVAAMSMVQGSVIDGLSELMAQEITLDKGRVVETNYHEHKLVTMGQTPPIEVHFVLSEANPSGLGEPALPPILPAVANAIFAATGDRVRTLPLAKSGYSWV